MDNVTVRREYTFCLDCGEELTGSLMAANYGPAPVAVWICLRCCARYPTAAALTARLVKAVTGELKKAPVPAPPAIAARRSCNRHDDCAAADARAEAAWQEEQKKPRQERRDLPRYADHCHDECCEDCFGS